MIRVGSILYGYCEGYFGRDSYENKRVEAIGADWIVCRDADGNVHLATGRDLIEKLEKHTTNPNPEEEVQDNYPGMCYHANENPFTCPCPKTCCCKSTMCDGKVSW